MKGEYRQTKEVIKEVNNYVMAIGNLAYRLDATIRDTYLEPAHKVQKELYSNFDTFKKTYLEWQTAKKNAGAASAAIVPST